MKTKTYFDLVEDNVRVVFEYIGEGYNGDYDPTDPEDKPLLRFDVFADVHLKNPYSEDPILGDFGYMLDSSYCTALPVEMPEDVINKALRVIMDEVKGEVIAGHSIKRICEHLSWLCPEDLIKKDFFGKVL